MRGVDTCLLYTAQQKEETQAALDEKMERWVYLSDLAEKIESQKNGQPV